MLRDKHRRRIRHVVLVTSNATDVGVRQFHIGSGSLWAFIAVLCIVIGAMLGYIAYEERIWQAVMDRSDVQLARIKQLEEANDLLKTENLSLGTEIDGLNETVQILSETVNLKTQSESELLGRLEQQSLPIRLPLNGSASMEESNEDNPICVFTASAGVTVVAAASGTVTGINDDLEYGHNVWVDHGNGYVTVYRNAGEPKVKLGESVVGGTTLFTIEEGQEKLGYHMMKDGDYISPTEMLDISG